MEVGWFGFRVASSLTFVRSRYTCLIEVRALIRCHCSCPFDAVKFLFSRRCTWVLANPVKHAAKMAESCPRLTRKTGAERGDDPTRARPESQESSGQAQGWDAHACSSSSSYRAQDGASGEVGSFHSAQDGASGEVGSFHSAQDGASGEVGSFHSAQDGASGEVGSFHSSHRAAGGRAETNARGAHHGAGCAGGLGGALGTRVLVRALLGVQRVERVRNA